MPINGYLEQVKKHYKTGISTEHTYRGALQDLINNLVSGITVTNEPKRQKCGAPDYIIQKKKVPLGYIEAKDIGIDLDKIEKSDQMKRYLGSLDNLILTDYLEFRFYKYGSKTHTLKLGAIENGKLTVGSEAFASFETHVKDFCSFTGQTIKSAEKLARMMAQKARMMEEVLFKAVQDDDDDNSLKEQFEAFRHILIHDLDEKTFADIYAQTIAYGLFAARLHDASLEDFSRQEARELIPRSNPFLRNLFDYVSGAQLDDRVVWIVDDLCEIFRAADLQSILTDFGKSTAQNDPFIHFYETFLAEYDPKLRKSRGVYYTPEPVVNFIVRAVDDILIKEFGLPKGLADTSKVKIKRTIEGAATKKGKKDIVEEVEVHKVQILDPATGTGTFLAETVKQIYTKFKGQEGLWSSYVENDLIPRINGFEILMASYTMCHLKISRLFEETGYKPKADSKQPRLNVFLTNSLEEAHPDTGTLFASWLSRESTEANRVKRDTPVMCVIGNPPYSGESANKGKWIMDLMEDYKKEPGGKEKLKERNPKWINDDYVKFIRYGQHFIEDNGEGVLAFINPHGFLDNPTFRGMRWNLQKTFDTIYTIDLHGNSKKKETCPDGSLDVNVFDIQQGVSINIFVKTGKKDEKELARVFHYDLYGKREAKYPFLIDNSLESVHWVKLPNKAPQYYMIQKNFKTEEEYLKGFSIKELWNISSVGVVTSRDSLVVDSDKAVLSKRIKELFELPSDEFKMKYNVKENKSWSVRLTKKTTTFDESKIIPFNYRPFDTRWLYYDEALIERGRFETMAHLNKHNTPALMACRQTVVDNWVHLGLTSAIADDSRVSNRSRERGYIFPLYLYADQSQTDLEKTQRTPNLAPEILSLIEKKLGLTFLPEKEDTEGTFAPIDLLDYIYAVLHSPSYREKYKEFLKIDFPRVPYPTDQKIFWQLVKLGGEIRQIHLLESPKVEHYITRYPVDGDNVITTKIEKKDWEVTDEANQLGRIWINGEQYFDKIPVTAWEFYIGGYQPAQKWLKDRKGRELSVDDIQHYQKIIVALCETDRLMKEIDTIKFD